MVDASRVPRWQHQEPDDVFVESTKPTSIQDRQSMFEQRTSMEDMPYLKPVVSQVKDVSPTSGQRFESNNNAPLESQDVCLYRHKPILPPDLSVSPEQGRDLPQGSMFLQGSMFPQGSRRTINKWGTTEDLSGFVAGTDNVMSVEVPAVADVTSPELDLTQEVTTAENGQAQTKSDSEVCNDVVTGQSVWQWWWF